MNMALLVKYIHFGFNYMDSVVRTDLSILTGRNISKPRQVYYLITEKCNVRCQMCPQWKRGIEERGEDWISAGRMKEILAELARWRVPKFGISGGEPLLLADKTFEILSAANSLGLYSHFVTNGWLLESDIFTRYESIGGGHISISIDGIGESHDVLRGKPELFAKCISAIETFRSLDLKNVKVKINTVLSKINLGEIGRLIELSRENHIPVFFQPFDPYDYASMAKLTQDELAEKHHLWIPSSDNEKLDDAVSAIKDYKRKSPHLVLNAEKHLNLISPYFKNEIKAGMKRKCVVAFDTISILPDGDVSICWIGKMGNLKSQSIKDTYYSQAFNSARGKTLKCEYPCLLGCYNRPGISELVRVGIRTMRASG